MTPKVTNLDPATVKGFGEEWSKFTQQALNDRERAEVFKTYFSLIDWTKKPNKVLDMGCGSGRWDVLVAPLVGELVGADLSPQALRVAKQNVRAANVSFLRCTPDTLPFLTRYVASLARYAGCDFEPCQKNLRLMECFSSISTMRSTTVGCGFGLSGN